MAEANDLPVGWTFILIDFIMDNVLSIDEVIEILSDEEMLRRAIDKSESFFVFKCNNQQANNSG